MNGNVEMDQLLSYIEQQQERWVEEFRKLVAFPSISAQQNEALGPCRLAVEDLMRLSGFTTQTWETGGVPAVFAERRSSVANAPTVLFYGHYDVQPPEPLELWNSPPFQMTERDGRFYGRGTADNKGQFLAHILAVQAWSQVRGELPVNVKMLVEGEEEMGSPSLAECVRQHREQLDADFVYLADGSMEDNDQPIICLGNRGVLTLHLSLRTANKDVHSGSKGPLVDNAIWKIVEVLAAMKDPQGKVLIPGFYQGVAPLSDFDRDLIERLPFDPVSKARVFGIKKISTSALETYSKIMCQPSLNINGISGGYQGKGSKTIVPAQASVKMDIRMVPGQDPDDLFAKVVDFVGKINPDVQVTKGHFMHPSKTDGNSAFCRSALRAVERGQKKEALLVPALGGSLPNYVWTGILRRPTFLAPYANQDADNHAPNENFSRELFIKGIRSTACLIDEVAQNHTRQRSDLESVGQKT